MEVAFTKMSVKGQVVIPQEVRAAVGFEESDKLIVYGMSNAVVIKKMSVGQAKRDLQTLFRQVDAKGKSFKGEEIEKEIQALRQNKRK